jgi:hypothetical protein
MERRRRQERASTAVVRSVRVKSAVMAVDVSVGSFRCAQGVVQAAHLSYIWPLVLSMYPSARKGGLLSAEAR